MPVRVVPPRISDAEPAQIRIDVGWVSAPRPYVVEVIARTGFTLNRGAEDHRGVSPSLKSVWCDDRSCSRRRDVLGPMRPPGYGSRRSPKTNGEREVDLPFYRRPNRPTHERARPL